MTDFQPGFRLSKIDVAVLVIGISSSVYIYSILPILSLIILFVISHFFIFCNITRMSRIPELIWATTFLVLATLSILHGIPSWVITCLTSGFLTLILIFLETKKPSYHGIFWKQINPNLLAWFKQKYD
jgi:hypothetical protein